MLGTEPVRVVAAPRGVAPRAGRAATKHGQSVTYSLSGDDATGLWKHAHITRSKFCESHGGIIMRVSDRKAAALLLATRRFSRVQRLCAGHERLLHARRRHRVERHGRHRRRSNADMGADHDGVQPGARRVRRRTGRWVCRSSARGASYMDPEQLNGGVIDQVAAAVHSLLPSHTIGRARSTAAASGSRFPYVAKNWRLANDNATLRVFYGRGGMNTDWDDGSASDAVFCRRDPCGHPPLRPAGVFGSGVAGVDLMQAFFSVNYAGQSGRQLRLGYRPGHRRAGVRSQGRIGVCTDTRDVRGVRGHLVADVTDDNGHDVDFGFGFVRAVSGGRSTTDSASGLAYQSKMSMDEFDDYSDLFAEQGGFDIPASIKGGLSFIASERRCASTSTSNTRSSAMSIRSAIR